MDVHFVIYVAPSVDEVHSLIEQFLVSSTSTPAPQLDRSFTSNFFQLDLEMRIIGVMVHVKDDDRSNWDESMALLFSQEVMDKVKGVKEKETFQMAKNVS